MSKPFTRWTEEERRANIRRKNAEYNARKVSKLTPRELEIKEQEKMKKKAAKQLANSGMWVQNGNRKLVIKEEIIKDVPVTVNKFSILDKDESSEEEVSIYKPKRLVWADEE